LQGFIDLPFQPMFPVAHSNTKMCKQTFNLNLQRKMTFNKERYLNNKCLPALNLTDFLPTKTCLQNRENTFTSQMLTVINILSKADQISVFFLFFFNEQISRREMRGHNQDFYDTSYSL
jgi:hypothetical protein